MHRLPLLLSTPSILWDRKLPEYVLFERTLNISNVNETLYFFKICEDEANNYFFRNADTCADKYNIALQHLEGGDKRKAMHLLNYIILSAPRDSVAFRSSLGVRGSIFYSEKDFEKSSHDFEIYNYVASDDNDNDEGLAEAYGKLVICKFMMRKYHEARRMSVTYHEHVKYMKEKSNSLKNDNILINKIDVELKEYEHIISPRLPCKIPQDFKKPLDSAKNACFDIFNNGNTKSTGVHANHQMPYGSLVLAEQPLAEDYGTPFIQCEFCSKQSRHMYTCLECHYKTYCSLHCMHQDCDHDIECNGYKYFTLITLDARNLFRLFVRIAVTLSKDIFSKPIFKKLRNVGDVWKKMLIILKRSEWQRISYLVMFFDEYDYNKLQAMQYSTVVATAFRLTMFISEKTEIIETLFSSLNISYKQKMILIGSILMRLHYQLLTHTFDFKIEVPLDKKPKYTSSISDILQKMGKDITPVSDYVGSVFDYYQINSENVNNLLTSLNLNLYKDEETTTAAVEADINEELSCSESQRALPQYMDHLIVSILKDEKVFGKQENGDPLQKISTLNKCRRLKFVQEFTRQFHANFAEYFLKMLQSSESQTQCIALTCPTLKRFRHSCDPNVEILLLENRLIVGKTVRKVENGEELFVSYKARYNKHSKSMRSEFLHQLDISCNCKYCHMPESENPYSTPMRIFCKKCKISFSLSDRKCLQCGIPYKVLLKKYINEMRVIEKQFPKENVEGCKHLEHYVVKDLVQIELFSWCHKLRICHKLEYAKFLAIRNFAIDAFDVIQKVFVIIKSSHSDDDLWFTYYREILIILKVMLYLNVNMNLYSAPVTMLLQVNKLGLHIIQGQLKYMHFYEIFYNECAPILEDLSRFLGWKQTICLMHLQSKEKQSIVELEDDDDAPPELSEDF